MSEQGDQTEATLAAIAESARGDPGLIAMQLVHCGDGLRIARMLLREEPESVFQAVAVEHLLRAQDELRQCVRAWLRQAAGHQAATALSPEEQATLDAARTTHEHPQP